MKVSQFTILLFGRLLLNMYRTGVGLHPTLAVKGVHIDPDLPGACRQVIMQAQKEYPPDLSNCKDKFLVQSVLMSAGSTGGAELNAELFDKSNSTNITDTKLKVVLVAPPAPPSPVPEGDEAEEPSAKVTTRTTDERHYTTLDDLAASTEEVNTLKETVKKLEKDKASLSQKLQMLELRMEGKATVASRTDASQALLTRSAGFTLLHLVLTAIICFLLGHYT